MVLQLRPWCSRPGALTHLLDTHGVTAAQRQAVAHRRPLSRELGHAGRVLGQPLGVDHAVELVSGEDGHLDVVAVTLNADVLHRTSHFERRWKWTDWVFNTVLGTIYCTQQVHRILRSYINHIC